MPLKRADLTASKRFVRADDRQWIDGDPDRGILPHPQHEGDDAWVELRTCLSGGEDARIIDLQGTEQVLDKDGGMVIRDPSAERADPIIFEILAIAWSLEAGKPKAEHFAELDAIDRRWIVQCMRRALDQARALAEGNAVSPGTASSPTARPTQTDQDQPSD